VKIGFLASHNGSSMRAIVRAVREGRLAAEPVIVIGNNADSPALAWARDAGMPAANISRKAIGEGTDPDRAIAEALAAARVELVVLSGYMRKLGPETLRRFRGRILNIHPALLPKYGGQGMYGRRVHDAVIAAGEPTSGISIHLVDDEYDHGPVLAQREVPVEPGDTAEVLEKRIQAAEPEFYIETLRRIVAGELKLPHEGGPT
jgi:phosphoribosylglycinamide formyltransferase-1